MMIRINEQPITLGEPLPTATRRRAALRRPGFWRRLLRRGDEAGILYEALNCRAHCFDDAFDLYPCTHGYLTADRQWSTDAHVVVRNGRVVSAVLRVIDGHYAATGFVDRFRESGTAVLGPPGDADRWTTRWTNGAAVVTSILQPDAKNACFLFEHASE
jgi:hypothetical protein